MAGQADNIEIKEGKETGEVRIRAYAKVNLGLDILGTREDGYHLVKMVMQSLDLSDTLTFRRTDKQGVSLSLSERSSLPDIGDLPTDERNLSVRAALRVLDRIPGAGGAEILLEKHIPMAAGMAGGSADCAAALRGVNRLYGSLLGEEELISIGLSLGADVPYCLMGGTALAEGIGEKLTPLPALPACEMVIVKPEFGASTGEVYRAYDRLDPARILHPDIDGMVAALREGSIAGVRSRLGNVLEEVTANLHPGIRRIRELLSEAGVPDNRMTGSGPTVFGILPEEGDPDKSGNKDKALDRAGLKESLEEALRREGIPARVYLTGSR